MDGGIRWLLIFRFLMIEAMKVILSSALVLFLSQISDAQPRAIAKSDYDSAFGYAARTTNAAFPFVFMVTTDTYENGKLVSTEKEVAERQAQGVERITKSLTKGGKTLSSHWLKVGLGNVYWRTDGKKWTGPQRFECPGPDGSGSVRLYGPRKFESVEYTVTEKPVKGQVVRIYREYSVFAPSGATGKKSFREKLATIDALDSLVEMTDAEGILDPRTVTLTRKQTWKQKAKFAPVKAPK